MSFDFKNKKMPMSSTKFYKSDNDNSKYIELKNFYVSFNIFPLKIVEQIEYIFVLLIRLRVFSILPSGQFPFSMFLYACM